MPDADPLPPLDAGELILEPLTMAHAEAMFEVLSDATLYRFLDQPPPVSVDALRERYARLTARCSPDGLQGWLNWIVCRAGRPIGFVQATVVTEETAWVAYLVGTPYQRRGWARQAMTAMLEHLVRQRSLRRFQAMAEYDNLASIATLSALGFREIAVDEGVPCEPTATERVFLLEACDVTAS